VTAADLPPLVGGPTDAVTETPELASGSVRRTTSVAMLPARSDGGALRVVCDLRGRDLRRSATGDDEVVDEIALRVEADEVTGAVLRLDLDRGPDALRELVGASLRRGFGRRLAQQWPDGGVERSLLYSLLEDLNGAFLVSGYARLREGRLVEPPQEGPVRAAGQEDVCAGWVRGGPVLETLRRTGRNAVPIGPVAPIITGDPPRWHAMSPVEVGTVRRLRCLDVARRPLDGPTEDIVVRAHFRDSYVGASAETVMHEYLVDTGLDPSTMALQDVQVQARVLPWQGCPAATGSASRLVGADARQLPALVRAELVGPSTCTHLNSTMRSLADVPALLGLLVEGAR
jgi:hypothetical protein